MSLYYYATHNHIFLIDMIKNYFCSTFRMQAIQELILKFMHFPLTYKLDIYIAASFIYLFLVISSIHPKNVNQMQNSLFFSAKYNVFIYCNFLYIIEIFLYKHLIQDFENHALFPKTLTDIIKWVINTLFKNIVLFILSYLLFLFLFAFEI